MTTAQPLITVLCPRCAHASQVLASFAGQQGKCPRCREVVVVPDPETAAAALAAKKQADEQAAQDAAAVAAALEPPPSPEAPVVAPAAALDPDHRLCGACGKPIRKAALKCRFCGDIADKPCPTCGEVIKATARKCRHCGEFLDLGLRQRRHEDHRYTLATPQQRLAAWAIDVGLRVPYYVAFALTIAFAADNMEAAAGASVLVAITWYAVLTVLEWSMTARTGQTYGKRWARIKVVRTDGGQVDFFYGVALRNWVVGVPATVCIVTMWLALFGFLFLGIDALMVFAEDRRTLHDHISSTRVIVVGSDEPVA